MVPLEAQKIGTGDLFIYFFMLLQSNFLLLSNLYIVHRIQRKLLP